MGIVIKQTIKGTIWSYIGVIIGFVTTGLLHPNFLTPEQIGLLGLLLSYSQLFGILSLLGLSGVTNRLFPYFRNSENGHNGFLIIALFFHIAGLTIFLTLFYTLKPLLIESNIESSPLFIEYLYLLVPISIANMLFNFLDMFNKVLYNATLGIFLQEFVQKGFILLATLLYIFELVTIHQYIIIYAIFISIKTVIILQYLIRKKEIKFRAPTAILNAKMKKEIWNVALFSLIGGFGSMIIFKVDKIIINQLMDLSNTGIYTIAFYFGTLISKPSQSLLRIAGTLVADAWKIDDRKTINDIYYKSCLNQLIIGGFLFLGIWANIDNILMMLGEGYEEAKWVIFFISLGSLIDMSTGANGQIISISKYYKISMFFLTILITLSLGLMFYLIPLWGIRGAAISIASALLVQNLLRYFFLYYKFKMQPFNINFLITIAFYGILYFVIALIPQQNLIVDILIRGSLITIASGLFFSFTPVSEDIQAIVAKALKTKLIP